MDDPRTGQIRALIEPILADRQLELVELTCRPAGGQVIVRLLVDRPGGITLAGCAQANQAVSTALEATNLISESYTVEVSSPGLDRPLTTKRDFERCVGERLRLTVAEGEGRTRELLGTLLAVQPEPEAVVLKLPSGNVTVPLAEIRQAKKAVQW